MDTAFSMQDEMLPNYFDKRGWSMIVTDDLIPNVLFMVSLVIGGVTGCFAVLVEVLDEYSFVSIEQSTLAAFLMGLTIGLILSSVLFGLISSAVNAVIVCFAGSPVEFQRNHSELSDEMRVAWREVWPGSYGYHRYEDIDGEWRNRRTSSSRLALTRCLYVYMTCLFPNSSFSLLCIAFITLKNWIQQYSKNL